jgi:hypothetical protein
MRVGTSPVIFVVAPSRFIAAFSGLLQLVPQTLEDLLLLHCWNPRS